MSEDNKISKAQQKAVNKYVKNNYDRINVTFPKGQKELLKEHAEKLGESVNAFIVRSVNERMEHGTESLAEAPAASSALLSPESLRTAQNCAEHTGETVPQFITRAIDSQAKRDDASRRLGLNPVTGK